MKRYQYASNISTVVALLASISMFSCGTHGNQNSQVAQPSRNQPSVPQTWISPENRELGKVTLLDANEEAAEKELTPHVDRLFDVSRTAVEKGMPISKGGAQSSASTGLPSDWVPWHMEFFTTDLSLTASGLVGALTVVGNPSVQAFWRRQNEPAKQPEPSRVDFQAEHVDSSMVLALNDSSDPKDTSHQIDMMVKAAMATGRVNDEANLREGLISESNRFREMVAALESADQSTPGSQWWVSRFRVDLIISASGTVGVSPISVGGTLRMRFEWQRISPKNRTSTQPKVIASTAPASNSSMNAFVTGMKTDLEAAAGDAYAETGLYPYQIRIGLGMTASGTVGVAKSSAELLGHVYFATNVSKPAVNPPVKAPVASGDIILIEKANHPAHLAHLALAEQNGVAVEESQDDVVYRIAHDKFVGGMRKAIHMGAFFAKRGARPTSSAWKLYQMYVGFDVSVSGTTGMASLGGHSSNEIDFYNGNF